MSPDETTFPVLELRVAITAQDFDRLAAFYRVGLGLVWDAPDYPLKEFTVRPDESVSSALNRLLGPLQVTRRYRTDAWVDSDNLVVRRRGNGPRDLFPESALVHRRIRSQRESTTMSPTSVVE